MDKKEINDTIKEINENFELMEECNKTLKRIGKLNQILDENEKKRKGGLKNGN